MMQEANRLQIARQILRVLPSLMRVVSAEVRRTEFAVAPAHFGLLAMLSHGSRSLGELAEKQGVSLPTMSNSVSTLTERGWVARSQSKSDRRVLIVELTPLGKQIFDDIQVRLEKRVMELLAGLSKEQLDHMFDGVEILEGVLPVPEKVSRFTGVATEEVLDESH